MNKTQNNKEEWYTSGVWCTYGYLNKNYPYGVAKIRTKNKEAVNLQIGPDQTYDFWWDINYVVFHNSYEEAMEVLLKKKINSGV